MYRYKVPFLIELSVLTLFVRLIVYKGVSLGLKNPNKILWVFPSIPDYCLSTALQVEYVAFVVMYGYQSCNC